MTKRAATFAAARSRTTTTNRMRRRRHRTKAGGIGVPPGVETTSTRSFDEERFEREEEGTGERRDVQTRVRTVAYE